MQSIITMLNQQKVSESKILMKQAKIELRQNKKGVEVSDDEDEDSDEEEDFEDDEGMEDHVHGEPTKDNYGEEEEKNQEEDSQASDDEDIDEVFDLSITIDMLKAPIKTVDEFLTFRELMNQFYARDGQHMNSLVQQLDEKQRKFL